jgi:hypothetical protein
MTKGRSHGKAGAALLALSMIFGITLFSGVTAQAQNGSWRDGQYRRDHDRDRDNDRNNDRDRERERRRRERERERRQEQNNGGYYGNNGGYGGYGRNGGYGNNGGYGTYGRNGGYGGYNVYQIATDRGYQDGLSTGQEDAYRGQNYDPQRSHYYRNGTEGYNSSYGSKGQYKQAYRDGFVRGYQQGYRRNGRGGYGNNGRNRAGSILGGIFGRP